MSAEPTSAQPRSIRKVVVASLIGTSLEWYDFLLYGSAAALVFNTLFFPEADPLTGTLLAFATSATGSVARPIGGIAPILLVVLRSAQGLGLGGERGGAVLMSLEHGQPDRRLLITMVSVWPARTDLHQEPAWT